MSFDASQPANNTKIRNLGNVIRPNFDCIERGLNSFRVHSLNVANRTALAIPADPAAIANTMVMYSKTDGGGNTQLYFVDPASRITQLSVAVQPSSATNGYTWLAGGMLLQWGQTGVSSGNNLVNFPITFSSSVYSVVITPVRNSTNVDTVYIRDLADLHASHFRCYNTSSSGINDICWMAIGPKV